MYTAKKTQVLMNIDCFYSYYRLVRNSNHHFEGHKHNFLEMNAIRSGSMTLECNDKVIHLSKNQIYFIRPNEFHSFTIDSDNSELFVLTFSTDYPIPDRVFDLSKKSISILNILVDELVSNYPDSNMFFSGTTVEQTVKNLSEILLLQCVHQDILPSKNDIESTLFLDIVRYMKQNITNKITIDDISKKFNVSNSSVKSMFKKYAHKGVIHYFYDLKLENAKIMLLEHHSISYIAEVLGFSSASHFSKKFKQKYGISPGRFTSDDDLY